jgi:hypothetical protein
MTYSIKISNPANKASAFARPSLNRGLAALGTSGLVFGLGVTSSTPAFANGEIVCTVGNTVTAVNDAEDNKDAILDVLTEGDTVCLSGDFAISSAVLFSESINVRGIDGSSITSLSGGIFSALDDMAGNITIENLTLTSAPGTAVVAYGVTVRDSTFSYNDGGAISSVGAFVFNSEFLSNDGGGISAAFVEVSGSNFSDNLTSNVDGAAIYADVDATITNSTFNGNVGLDGGAVNAGGLIVSNSVFTENVGTRGGAIWANSVEVTNSTFEANVADIESLGGAIYAATVEVANSTFVANEALYGGAVYADGVLISNSTFVSNAAVGEGSEGGAIYSSGGEVLFSTFLNNLASEPPVDPQEDTPGNAIYKVGGFEFVLGGNIFAGISEYPQLGYGVSVDRFVDIGGNIFTTSADTETDILQNASVFGASLTSIFGTASPSLAYNLPNSNGTQTIALVPGSPALDIVPFEVFGGSPFNSDQRGALRANPADAGAFELGSLATTGSTAPWWAVWSSAAMLAIGGLALAMGRSTNRRKN